MKIKKWQMILAGTVALLIMVISPLAVFAAQDNQSTASFKLQMEGGLAIVAPRQVLAGQEMSLGVFFRQNQEPVAGVSVWGITKETAETLKNEMSTLKEKGANLMESEYEAVLTGRAFRIGETKDDGRLTYTFQEKGNYVMIAFKAHYWPDVAGIAVREKPVVLPALLVQSPRKATIGETVIITVSQRGTGDAVKDAAVWAIGKEKATELREQVAKMKASGEAQNADWESIVALYGVKLGETNGDGMLKAEFDNPGGYLLVAVERGYIPGYTGILILELQITEQPDLQPTE